MNGMPMDLQENVSHVTNSVPTHSRANVICNCLVLNDHQTKPSAPAAPLQTLCNRHASAVDHAQCVSELHGPQCSLIPIPLQGHEESDEPGTPRGQVRKGGPAAAQLGC